MSIGSPVLIQDGGPGMEFLFPKTRLRPGIETGFSKSKPGEKFRFKRNGDAFSGAPNKSRTDQKFPLKGKRGPGSDQGSPAHARRLTDELKGFDRLGPGLCGPRAKHILDQIRTRDKFAAPGPRGVKIRLNRC